MKEECIIKVITQSRLTFLICVSFLLFFNIHAHTHEGENHSESASHPMTPMETTVTEEMQPDVMKEEIIQQICPVMFGNKIDPNIFTTYKGEKVYFCCMSCKEDFEKNPEQYLHRLPQFTTTATQENEHEFEIEQLVKPMGIATLVFLLLTASSGYFMPKKRKILFTWHKRLAYTTLIIAVCHAVLVIFFG